MDQCVPFAPTASSKGEGDSSSYKRTAYSSFPKPCDLAPSARPWCSSLALNIAEVAASFMELWRKGLLVELYTSALGSPKDALIPHHGQRVILAQGNSSCSLQGPLEKKRPRAKLS